MGQIIAVVSGKGGTGKTSFVSHVGLYLAKLGNRVLCLDCDIGLRNLDIALGMSDCAVTDFTDVLEGRYSLKEAATPHPIQKNLHCIRLIQGHTAQTNTAGRIGTRVRTNYSLHSGSDKGFPAPALAPSTGHRQGRGSTESSPAAGLPVPRQPTGPATRLQGEPG